MADALLEPTVIYVRAALDLLRSDIPVNGLAHITGGGLRNLLRLGGERLGFAIEAPLPVPPSARWWPSWATSRRARCGRSSTWAAASSPSCPRRGPTTPSRCSPPAIRARPHRHGDRRRRPAVGAGSVGPPVSRRRACGAAQRNCRTTNARGRPPALRRSQGTTARRRHGRPPTRGPARRAQLGDAAGLPPARPAASRPGTRRPAPPRRAPGRARRPCARSRRRLARCARRSRAEIVGDVEHDVGVAGVAAGAQARPARRRGAPTGPAATATRTASGSVSMSHSGLVGRRQRPGDGPRQVLVEQEVPQQRARLRRRGDQLADPRPLPPRRRRRGRGARRTAHSRRGRRGPERLRALAPRLGVVQAHVPPRPRAGRAGPGARRARARRPRACARRGRRPALPAAGRPPGAALPAAPPGGVRSGSLRAPRSRSRSARRSLPPTPTGSPAARRAAWTSSSWRRIIDVSRPRRRWVGRTPTAVTAAHGTTAPGTVTWRL